MLEGRTKVSFKLRKFCRRRMKFTLCYSQSHDPPTMLRGRSVDGADSLCLLPYRVESLT